MPSDLLEAWDAKAIKTTHVQENRGFRVGGGRLDPPQQRRFQDRNLKNKKLRTSESTYLRLVTHFVFYCGSGPEHGHETALELVYGANLGCVLHHFSSPTRWNGSRGQVRPETGRKPNKNHNCHFRCQANVSQLSNGVARLHIGASQKTRCRLG